MAKSGNEGEVGNGEEEVQRKGSGMGRGENFEGRIMSYKLFLEFLCPEKGNFWWLGSREFLIARRLVADCRLV